MGLFGAIFDTPKKKSPEELAKISRGQSVAGNVLGTSPFMRERNLQARGVNKDFKYKELDMRKNWADEDKEIWRHQQEKREEFERKYKNKPGEAEKWFSKWKRAEDQKLQRERDREAKDLKWEKVDTIRDIPKNIRGR